MRASALRPNRRHLDEDMMVFDESHVRSHVDALASNNSGPASGEFLVDPLVALCLLVACTFFAVFVGCAVILLSIRRKHLYEEEMNRSKGESRDSQKKHENNSAVSTNENSSAEENNGEGEDEPQQLPLPYTFSKGKRSIPSQVDFCRKRSGCSDDGSCISSIATPSVVGAPSLSVAMLSSLQLLRSYEIEEGLTSTGSVKKTTVSVENL